jgi:hypothetical protein
VTDSHSIIRVAFQRVAPHASNIQRLREITEVIAGNSEAPEEIVARLRSIMVHEDITVRTDIRILINEIRHIVAGNKST